MSLTDQGGDSYANTETEDSLLASLARDLCAGLKVVDGELRGSPASSSSSLPPPPPSHCHLLQVARQYENAYSHDPAMRRAVVGAAADGETTEGSDQRDGHYIVGRHGNTWFKLAVADDKSFFSPSLASPNAVHDCRLSDTVRREDGSGDPGDRLFM